MIANGATNEDVTKYASEFKLKYDNDKLSIVSPSEDGKVSTDWIPDPTGSQKYVYQVRDCKWFAKNTSTNKEFNISINPKYNSSINILNNAHPELIKDCNKPAQTQPDNQNVVTGGGQQPGQTGSAPSTGGQPAPNQTQGLGVPNVSELGLDEIDKLVNPVKPEDVTTTATQQESIKINTDILKEEFYSTFKKIS
jgi:hypothetical protein